MFLLPMTRLHQSNWVPRKQTWKELSKYNPFFYHLYPTHLYLTISSVFVLNFLLWFNVLHLPENSCSWSPSKSNTQSSQSENLHLQSLLTRCVTSKWVSSAFISSVYSLLICTGGQCCFVGFPHVLFPLNPRLLWQMHICRLLNITSVF